MVRPYRASARFGRTTVRPYSREHLETQQRPGHHTVVECRGRLIAVYRDAGRAVNGSDGSLQAFVLSEAVSALVVDHFD